MAEMAKKTTPSIATPADPLIYVAWKAAAGRWHWPVSPSKLNFRKALARLVHQGHDASRRRRSGRSGLSGDAPAGRSQPDDGSGNAPARPRRPALGRLLAPARPSFSVSFLICVMAASLRPW